MTEPSPSSPPSQTQQNPKKSYDIKQTFQTAIKVSNEHFKKIRKQIKIQQQKIARANAEAQIKVGRVFQKTYSKQYAKQTNQDLEIPVDGQLERGSQIFTINCASCHSLQATSQNTAIGPALGLIYNRKIGSDASYYNYSEGMIKNKSHWTPANLYKFMYNPKSMISDTKCPISKYQGIKSQQDRADILQFLKQYSYQFANNLKIQQVKSKGYQMYQTQIYANKQAKTHFEDSPPPKNKKKKNNNNNNSNSNNDNNLN